MKTRVITAIVGIIVLIGVMFTFNTLIFNLVIAAITLIAIHEIYSALGFEKKDWLMYAVLVPYTLLVMTSNYQVMRRLVMPMSFLLVTFYAIYLVVRNGTISYQKVMRTRWRTCCSAEYTYRLHLHIHYPVVFLQT